MRLSSTGAATTAALSKAAHSSAQISGKRTRHGESNVGIHSPLEKAWADRVSFLLSARYTSMPARARNVDECTTRTDRGGQKIDNSLQKSPERSLRCAL
jgi:hypothetical protein